MQYPFRGRCCNLKKQAHTHARLLCIHEIFNPQVSELFLVVHVLSIRVHLSKRLDNDELAKLQPGKESMS